MRLPKIAKVCIHELCMQTWLPCASSVSLQTHSMVDDTTNAELRSQNCSKMSTCKLLGLSRYALDQKCHKGFEILHTHLLGSLSHSFLLILLQCSIQVPFVLCDCAAQLAGIPNCHVGAACTTPNVGTGARQEIWGAGGRWWGG